MTPKEWLNSASNLGAGTWREWFAEILTDLFYDGEGFSGKRPGAYDSDWQHQIALSLVNLGCIKGKFEVTDPGTDYEFHELIDFDRDEYEWFTNEAIRELCAA